MQQIDLDQARRAVDLMRAEVDEFIRENKPLVEGPNSDTTIIGGVIQIGAELAIRHERILTELSEKAVRSAGEYEDAIRAMNAGRARPVTVDQKKKPYERDAANFRRANAAMTDLISLVDHAREVYRGRTDAYPAETFAVEESGEDRPVPGSESESHTPWWQRLLGNLGSR